MLIPFHEFVRTNHGMVVEPQREMLRQKVRTVGMSLIDRVPGPFDLSVSRIWATNGLTAQERLEAAGISQVADANRPERKDSGAA